MDGNLEALRVYELEQARAEKEHDEFLRTGKTAWERLEETEELRWEQMCDDALFED